MYNKKVSNLLAVIFSAVFLLLIFSCRQVNVYEKNITVPGYSWKKNSPVTGTFTISDTLSSYRLYVVLRHTDAYNYNNIWLNIGLRANNDSMVLRKFDVQLGEDATGWEGTGMNDLWEVRKLLAIQPLKKGNYTFQISHIMRDDPLNNVLSAGLRIEKAAGPVNK